MQQEQLLPAAAAQRFERDPADDQSIRRREP